jgi:hypothetical protein
VAFPKKQNLTILIRITQTCEEAAARREESDAYLK